MAQYKVPQDVEADDKLLGPFSFRQFVYLLIAAALIALAVALFQLFPLLAIIPVPFILLLGALALPIKKDQPMEAYLVAVVSYYLKPRTKVWRPGQRESTIKVTAPKQVEDESRARDITGEEVTHRLSFLADIVDTEGYAIKGAGGSPKLKEELVEEANMAHDIFETHHFDNLEDTIARDENAHHAKVVQEMREAIAENERMASRDLILDSNGINNPNNYSEKAGDMGGKSDTGNVMSQEKTGQMMAKPSIIDLANNTDYTVATISKEANRIKERDEGEVFVSLH
ncbi:PrgI family protein [Candidatus Saccharibacteria bacterium]|nr:PrgI family protein [Candidatus Saccharibacteria bacterium]